MHWERTYGLETGETMKSGIKYLYGVVVVEAAQVRFRFPVAAARLKRTQ